MRVYYNEIDRYCCQWLHNLMREGLIPEGDIDDRSIADVRPSDLDGYDQCHFFAGIGGWAYALELANYHGPVWTGSCPCQPFSTAGQRKAGADERHLWPAWLRLIRECGPDRIFGEQVEGAVGLGWLDRVFADLEDEGYACGAAVLGAHSVGLPQNRPRIWYMADAGSQSIQRPEQARCGIRGVQVEAHTKRCNGSLSSGLWDSADTCPAYWTDGLPRPVGIVRALGNSIPPQTAAEFVRAAVTA